MMAMMKDTSGNESFRLRSTVEPDVESALLQISTYSFSSP